MNIASRTLLLAALVCVPPASGQTWSRFRPSTEYAVGVVDDAGLVWASVNTSLVDYVLVCFDASGQQLFSRETDTSATLASLSPHPGGGAWWSGYGRTVRYDVAGNPIEEILAHAGGQQVSLWGVLPTPGGGLALYGSVFDWANVAPSGYVAKFDAAGVLVWSFSYHDLNKKDFCFIGAVVRSDGSHVLTGEQGTKTMVASLGSSGSLVWALIDQETSVSRQRVIAGPGNDVLVAWQRTGGTLVTRIDAAGAQVWAYEATGFFMQDADASASGGLWLAGARGGSDDSGALIEVSADGALTQAWEWGVDQPDRFLAISADANGLLLAGVAQPTGTSSEAVQLLRLDANAEGAECAGLPYDQAWSAAAHTLVPAPGWTRHPQPAWRSTLNGPPNSAGVALIEGCFGPLGDRYCSPAVPNSSGQAAELVARGNPHVATNTLVLGARQMPLNQPGYFLVGAGTGIVQPPGSQGDLCLAGAAIGRYAKDVLSSGAEGAFELDVDLTDVPLLGAVQSGETWGFQAWFRDTNGGGTSNFTDSVRVLFN